MGRRVLDVFLSSTAMDLKDYRGAVYAELTRTGLFHAVRQEDFGARNAGAVAFCRDEVQKADLFIGLIGLRRGWEPEGDSEMRSITEMELGWARDAGRPRYLWVAPDNFPVPGDMWESDELRERQMAFRKRVMAGGEIIVSREGFDTPELLAAEIARQLLMLVAKTSRAAIKAVGCHAHIIRSRRQSLAELEAKWRNHAQKHEAGARRSARISAAYWCRIGALAFLHDTGKALSAYRKAVSLDEENPDGWRFLGELCCRVGDRHAARNAFERLLKLGLTLRAPQIQVIAHLCLSRLESPRGNLGNAQQAASEALRIAKAANWREGMARASRGLAHIAFARGEFGRAQELRMQALSLENEPGVREVRAAKFCSLGATYEERGDLSRAEQMLLNAIKLYGEPGARGEGLADAHARLGVILEKRSDLRRAQKMQIKALTLYTELGKKREMAEAYRNLGAIFERQGRLDRAREMQRRARELEALRLEDAGREPGFVERAVAASGE